MNLLKLYLNFACSPFTPPLAQIASIAALDEGDEYLKELLGSDTKEMLISELKN